MKVAIVGGGVGGLVAAIALARNDFEVKIYEQAPELTAVGASLQLGPNALRLMDDLGLLPSLRRIGVRPDAVEFRRWDDGSVLLHTPLGSEMEEYFGAPQLDFFRPDLQRLLADSLSPGALRLGSRVAGIQQHDDGVTIELADGTRAGADLAIAADGIRSLVHRGEHLLPSGRRTAAGAGRFVRGAARGAALRATPANLGARRQARTYRLAGGGVRNRMSGQRR
jgi:salicylate hydroxylase